VVSDRIKNRRQVCNLDHHGNNITCLAVHPSSHTVATGDAGGKSGGRCRIVIWDDNSGSTMRVLSDFHLHGVARLCFSENGALLFSVGLDVDHSVAVNHILCQAYVCMYVYVCNM
jgi:WD40 repeat protein